MQPSEPKSPPSKRAESGHVDSGSARSAAPAEPPAALQSAPSLGALMHSLRRSWKVVMPAAFLLAAIVGGVAWMLVPAQYTSTLVLRLLSRPTLGNLDQDEIFANVQKAQVAILKSHEVLSESIIKSGITNTHGIVETPQSLGRKLVTHFNDGPEMLAVQLSGENPEAVASLLNAIGDVLPARMLRGDDERVKGMIELKDRSLREMAGKLSEARSRLRLVEKEHKLDKVEGVANKRDEARRQHGDALRDLRLAEAELIRLKGNRESALRRIQEPLPSPILEGDVDAAAATVPGVQQLLLDIEIQRKKLADIIRLAAPELRDELAAKPRSELRLMETRLEQVRDQVRQRMMQRAKIQLVEQEKRSLQELDDKIKAQDNQITSVKGEVTRWQTRIDELAASEKNVPPEVLAARDEVTQLEREQARVGEQKAGLQGLFPIVPRLRRHSEAFVPTEKDYSRPLKYSLAAAAFVFGACLIGGCLLEARSRKISDSAEVREGLGLRIIGTVPALPSAARRKSAAALSMGGLDSQYGLTEAVDAVRTRLLHAPRVDGARTIMITSATTGEGKTTLASHLAASLARAWRKTLLIDGDLRNPNAHLQFDVPSEPGLSEALRGEMEYEDAILPTSLSRLWVLPAGKIDAHALQALTQDGLSEVFDRLKEQFDFIVIDTSPVIPVPDALVLGQQADAVILSVMRDVSRMPAVYAAQQSLEDLGIRVLGAVVSGEKTELYGKAVPYGPVPGSAG